MKTAFKKDETINDNEVCSWHILDESRALVLCIARQFQAKTSEEIWLI